MGKDSIQELESWAQVMEPLPMIWWVRIVTRRVTSEVFGKAGSEYSESSL